MTIHEKLNNCINKKGLKQVFVSEKSGIPPDRLSKVLNGKRRLTADDFLRICIAIDEDPNNFRPTS